MYCSTVCVYIYVSLHLTIFIQFDALDMVIIYHNVTMSQCKQGPCIENTIQNTVSQKHYVTLCPSVSRNPALTC